MASVECAIDSSPCGQCRACQSSPSSWPTSHPSGGPTSCSPANTGSQSADSSLSVRFCLLPESTRTGGMTGPGNELKKPCGPGCGRRWGESPHPARPSSTASRLRRWQTGNGTQASHRGGPAKGGLLAAAVHAANIRHRDGAKLVLAKLLGRSWPRAFSSLRMTGVVGWWVRWNRTSGGKPCWEPGSAAFMVAPVSAYCAGVVAIVGRN